MYNSSADTHSGSIIFLDQILDAEPNSLSTAVNQFDSRIKPAHSVDVWFSQTVVVLFEDLPLGGDVCTLFLHCSC